MTDPLGRSPKSLKKSKLPRKSNLQSPEKCLPSLPLDQDDDIGTLAMQLPPVNTYKSSNHPVAATTNPKTIGMGIIPSAAGCSISNILAEI